ncbi:hypothetical protein R6Z07M_018187 [Ovis aries]
MRRCKRSGGSSPEAPQREVSGSGFCFLRIPSLGPPGTAKTPARAPRGGRSGPCALCPQRAAVPPTGASAAWGLKTNSWRPLPVPPESWRLFSGLGRAEMRPGVGAAAAAAAPSRAVAAAAAPAARAPVLGPRRSLARAAPPPRRCRRPRAPLGLRERDQGEPPPPPPPLSPRSPAPRAARSQLGLPPAAALAPASLLRRAYPPASWPIGGHQAAAVAGRIRGSRPPPPSRSAPFLLQPAGGRRREAWVWAGADTANWRRRQGTSWPLSAALATSHLPAGRAEAGTSPFFADVLKLRSFGVLVFLFFPLGV